MKSRLIILLLVVMCATLLLTGAASADETKTPFTGIEYIIDEVWEGRYWVPGPNLVFWRGTTFVTSLETTDARITGNV